MSRVRVALLVLAAAFLAAAVYLVRPEPSVTIGPRTDGLTGAALVTRGEYLAKAADCTGCHTRPGGEPYAGGVGFRLAIGTIYAPNITPDAETGIGAWSDADFVRAIRRGVGRHGEMLYPAFPYASYALMSVDDALAIKVYLHTLPAVRATRPPNHLAFPFNQRPILRFWRALYVPASPFKEDPGRGSDWNRGAYLALALGHCGECHTPRTLLYGLDGGRQLAGGEISGERAYNLTPDVQAGIGGWSDSELLSYLATGRASHHGATSGSMAEVVGNSLRYLTSDDLRALVVYLRSVPAQSDRRSVPTGRPAPMQASTAVGPPADEDAPAMGRQLFASACTGCHAWDGTGRQTAFSELSGSRSTSDPRATNLVRVMLQGSALATAPASVSMPAFARGYSDTEIAALANYVLRHFGGTPGEIGPGDVALARKSL